MKFEIPQNYRVGGQEISVEIVDKIGKTEDLGQCNVAEGKVKIAKNCSCIVQSDSSMLNTFFHELVHSILITMAEAELNKNEKFVSGFAGFLTEAIVSMEFNGCSNG